jgi:hypothetical protein
MLAAKQQGRLDGFFKPQPKAAGSAANGKSKDESKGAKRKVLRIHMVFQSAPLIEVAYFRVPRRRSRVPRRRKGRSEDGCL